MRSQLKLLKPAIARITPLFLFASFFLSAPPLLTPYSLLPASAQTADARKAEADRLMQQGNNLSQTGQYQAAIQSYEQTLAILRAIQDREGESKVLSNLGRAYQDLKNYTKAIEYQQQSLEIAREVKNRRSEGIALVLLGIAYDSVSNYSRAIECYQPSLAIARKVKDPRVEVLALVGLGEAYSALGNYTKAIEYAEQALAIAREIKNRKSESYALNKLGQAYFSLSNYTKAIEYYQQSLTIAWEIGDRQGEINALGNLGLTYRELSSYAKAIEYAEQVLAIAYEIKDRQSEGKALNDLGSTYSFLSNYGKALEYYQQSLAIAREIKNRREEGYVLGNLGNTYRDLGDYARALEYYQQVIVIVRATQDRATMVKLLSRIGVFYSSIGDYTKAIEVTQQSLAIAREIKDRSAESAALDTLGLSFRSLGDYTKAVEYYQQSLAIAREIKNRRNEGRVLEHLGVAYSLLGDYAKAVEYQQQSLAIAREIKDLQGEGASLSNLGFIFLKSGDLPSAEKTLFAAIQVWETIRGELGNNDANKVSIFEGQDTSYRSLQEALIRQNKTTAALEIAERGRARAFIELLAQRLAKGSSNSSSDGLALGSAPTQSQIKQIAKDHNATLVQYSVIYDGFKIQGKSEVRESALYIWVIQPTGEISFRNVDLKPLWQHQVSLTDLIIGNQEFLAIRSRSSNSTKSQPDLPTLHQLLIAPIANLLPKDPNAHLIFMPQGALFQVPFPALQDANGNYLIQKHTILTAPSIQVLALTRKQRQKLAKQQSGNALVLGNPTMPGVSPSFGAPKQTLSPLPGAAAEANAIAPLLHTQAITGAQGTKAAVVQKMLQATIIHLATHGLLDDVRGLGSAIALAPSGKDNGWLTAEEILDMKLQANLVVLSACNTAQGRTTGDGIIGLSRSLIAAGVPSVLVSLWSVPDAPTAELMQAFYQNLQKHPDKAQALRQAMLTTMKTHPQPRDWAAFTLIGESN